MVRLIQGVIVIGDKALCEFRNVQIAGAAIEERNGGSSRMQRPAQSNCVAE
jgi:hypothetical protein